MSSLVGFLRLCHNCSFDFFGSIIIARFSCSMVSLVQLLLGFLHSESLFLANICSLLFFTSRLTMLFLAFSWLPKSDSQSRLPNLVPHVDNLFTSPLFVQLSLMANDITGYFSPLFSVAKQHLHSLSPCTASTHCHLRSFLHCTNSISALSNALRLEALFSFTNIIIETSHAHSQMQSQTQISQTMQWSLNLIMLMAVAKDLSFVSSCPNAIATVLPSLIHT